MVICTVISMLGWSSRSDLVTLRESPHRDVWLMHPAIVNAWYSPNHNTISECCIVVAVQWVIAVFFKFE